MVGLDLPVIAQDLATERRFGPTPWLEAEHAVCGLSVPVGAMTAGRPATASFIFLADFGGFENGCKTPSS